MIQQQYFEHVFLNGNDKYWLPYYFSQPLPAGITDDLLPLTGAMTRPAIWLQPNPVVRGGDFPLADPSLHFCSVRAGCLRGRQPGSRATRRFLFN